MLKKCTTFHKQTLTNQHPYIQQLNRTSACSLIPVALYKMASLDQIIPLSQFAVLIPRPHNNTSLSISLEKPIMAPLNELNISSSLLD